MARILIVDDESNIRMMLRLALVHSGHTVETAADGEEALEKFGPDGAAWDLVLLDHRMAGLEGLEVLTRMRARRPDARVVMITAFGTINLAADALAAGATDFLRKPFTIETLRGSVDAALAVDGRRSDAAVLAFDGAGINGFRLEPAHGVERSDDGGFVKTFAVRPVSGDDRACRVEVPGAVAERVRAQADRRALPGGDAFWEALCGHALANWLWQNAAFPPGGRLRVDDLTSGLRNWIETRIAAC